MAWRSVSKGVHRRSIELRNHRSGVPTLSSEGEGNMNKCDMRVLVQLPGVRDLWHVHTLHEREPGELGRDCHEIPQTVLLGKAKAAIPACGASEQSDRPIVPEKPSNKAPSILNVARKTCPRFKKLMVTGDLKRMGR